MCELQSDWSTSIVSPLFIPSAFTSRVPALLKRILLGHKTKEQWSDKNNQHFVKYIFKRKIFEYIYLFCIHLRQRSSTISDDLLIWKLFKSNKTLKKSEFHIAKVHPRGVVGWWCRAMDLFKHWQWWPQPLHRVRCWLMWFAWQLRWASANRWYACGHAFGSDPKSYYLHRMVFYGWWYAIPWLANVLVPWHEAFASSHRRLNRHTLFPMNEHWSMSM